MPEGPSIAILKEELMGFVRKKVQKASGEAGIHPQALEGKTVRDIKSWGKHLLICFGGFYIKVHLMMFGTYSINNKKKLKPTLSLEFNNGEVNFYTCVVKLIEGVPEEDYDWEKDLLSDKWSAAQALKNVKELDKTKICDALLDQEIFAGSGNIIKNEVLYRAKVHPLSLTDKIPTASLKKIIKEARNYSFDFLKWKKQHELAKHWQAYDQKECERCKLPMHTEYLGKGKRITFYCSNCQELYK